MPIPTELKGKVLIGSRWIRRMGKHRGTEVTITQHNEAGCKFEIRTRTAPGNRSHLGDKRVGSAQWPMFLTLYEVEGKLKDMMVTVDKEGYVVKTPHVDLTAPIVRREEDMVAQVEKRLCTGPWHRRGGQGTMLPVTEFGTITRGPHVGQVAKTCNTCLAKRRQYESSQEYKIKASEEGRSNGRISKALVKEIVPVVEEVVPLAPVIQISEKTGPLFRWKVTIVKETEVIVEAMDYLDAGVNAGDGEVIKVERL